MPDAAQGKAIIVATDARLRKTARRLGVTTLHERVADFAVLDEEDPRIRRILGLHTAEGTFVRASWFLDASGSDSSLPGKRFGLKSVAFGPRKVAIWSHVPTQQWVEGTTTFLGRTYEGECGTNWIIIGEAASPCLSLSPGGLPASSPIRSGPSWTLLTSCRSNKPLRSQAI